MKKAYPIAITEGNDHKVVFIPDFDIYTQGGDIPEAIEMARDAIGITGIDMEDEGEVLPQETPMQRLQKEFEDALITLVDVDFTEYRRKNDMRTVRKNCSIPSWLNFEAEKAGINFSAVLQNALKTALHISE